MTLVATNHLTVTLALTMSLSLTLTLPLALTLAPTLALNLALVLAPALTLTLALALTLMRPPARCYVWCTARGGRSHAFLRFYVHLQHY